MEHVLPALKTKRRKRKPPSGRFWWTFGNFFYCAVVGTWNLLVLEGAPMWLAALHLVCAGLMLYLAITFWWPRFKKELDRWHKDNEE